MLGKRAPVLALSIVLSLTAAGCTVLDAGRASPAAGGSLSRDANDGTGGGSGQPGAVAGGDGQAVDNGHSQPGEPEPADPATWPVYTDDTYPFRISYPPAYVIHRPSETELGQLDPLPLAAIYFQDPQTAQSDVADMAPAAFSIRVFAIGQRDVEEWLGAVGLLNLKAGWYTEPYQGKYESGIAVYSTAMIAPGWWVYVTHGATVYQLTPLGTEAELMLSTFAVN